MSVSFNIAEPEKGPDHHSQRSVYEEVYLKTKGGTYRARVEEWRG